MKYVLGCAYNQEIRRGGEKIDRSTFDYYFFIISNSMYLGCGAKVDLSFDFYFIYNFNVFVVWC